MRKITWFSWVIATVIPLILLGWQSGRSVAFRPVRGAQIRVLHMKWVVHSSLLSFYLTRFECCAHAAGWLLYLCWLSYHFLSFYYTKSTDYKGNCPGVSIILCPYFWILSNFIFMKFVYLYIYTCTFFVLFNFHSRGSSPVVQHYCMVPPSYNHKRLYTIAFIIKIK